MLLNAWRSPRGQHVPFPSVAPTSALDEHATSRKRTSGRPQKCTATTPPKHKKVQRNKCNTTKHPQVCTFFSHHVFVFSLVLFSVHALFFTCGLGCACWPVGRSQYMTCARMLETPARGRRGCIAATHTVEPNSVSTLQGHSSTVGKRAKK